MSIILWNVRGLNHSRISDVKFLLQSHQPSIVCLIETKVKTHNSHRITNFLPADWSSINNYDHDSHGRIWVLWNFNTWSCSLISSSDQYIIVRAPNKGGFDCIISFIYAHNFQNLRRQLWHDLLYFSTQCSPLASNGRL